MGCLGSPPPHLVLLPAAPGERDGWVSSRRSQPLCSFCKYTADGVSSVSDVFGTHIENIGSRGGEQMISYGHRVTHTLAVAVGDLGKKISIEKSLQI